jgi:hypothetical protein
MLSLSKHLYRVSNPIGEMKRERCFDKLRMTANLALFSI